jgi:hypothetical protein
MGGANLGRRINLDGQGDGLNGGRIVTQPEVERDIRRAGDRQRGVDEAFRNFFWRGKVRVGCD